MVALVTLEEAKSRLRLDFHDEDEDTVEMLEQATDIVIGYIKRPDHGWTDETVPDRIKAAILVVVARMEKDREGQLEGGIINETVRSLLIRDRDPALA